MGTGVRDEISPDVDAALIAAAAAAGEIAGEVDSLGAPQLESLVPALAQLMSRFEAVRLAALRAADRLRVADRSGMRSTADWVAAACGDKRGRARGDCELADKLSRRPVFAEALAAGGVSKAQAAALADAIEPTETEQRDLLAEAEGLSVNELERRVTEFNFARQPPADDPVVPAVEITTTRHGVNACVTLGAVEGEIFTTALDAAAQQLTFEQGTPLWERRAAGLTAVCRYFLDHHQTVTHRLGRPHVVVTVPIDVLTASDPTGSAALASGAPIDAATARALACDASVSRLITGPQSEPLDIGRATRSIPVPMARQLIVEDRHCRWPGCQSPAWSCEGHHVIWWAGPYRGATRLSNLCLLCWYHHHLLHKDQGWRLHLAPDTRRLTVHYHDRYIGATDPPGRRRRTEPVDGPATAPNSTQPAASAPVPHAQAKLLLECG